MPKTNGAEKSQKFFRESNFLKSFTRIKIRYEKILMFLGGILFLALDMVATEELKTKPYFYTQNFEEADPVEFWTKSRDVKYKLNFKGLTEDKAFFGKKSFKLDIIGLEGRGYCFWKILVNISAMGKLKMSARIWIEKIDSYGGLGWHVRLNPISRSGNRPINYLSHPTKKWILQADILLTLNKQT